MAFYLARKIHHAIQNRLNKSEDPIAGQDSSDTITVHGAEPSGTADPRPKTPMRWRILLMAALLIPVFLETLDYTGRFLSH